METKEDLSGRSCGQTPLSPHVHHLLFVANLEPPRPSPSSKEQIKSEKWEKKKQGRTVKQDETLNSLSIEQSQGLYFLLRRYREYSKQCPFELFCRF